MRKKGKHTRLPAIIPEHVLAVRKTLIDDNSGKNRALDQPLYMKLFINNFTRKISLSLVCYNLADIQKAECVKISKETLKVLNDARCRFFLKL